MRRSFLTAIFICLTGFLTLNSSLAQSGLEDRIGESTLASVERSMGFYENDTLLHYVQKIGRKLEDQLPDNPYEFKYHLVDTPEPNAFATADGYVFVNRGIFPIIDTEDEMAGILGHEFTHVILRHSTKKVYRNILPAILEMPGNLLAAFHSDLMGELVNLPVEFASKTTDAAFSRHEENRADEMGIQFATAAGYDPSGLKSALIKLEKYVENRYNIEEHFTLFLDHPLTKDRVGHLDALARKYNMHSKDPVPMMHHLDGIIIGQNPEQGMILPDHSFVHPEMDLLLEFPSEWKIDNTPLALTATDPTGYSGFAMALEESTSYPDSAALNFAKKLDPDIYRIEISDRYDLNGWEAIDVLLKSENIRQLGYTRVTWIQSKEPGILLRLIGTAHSEDHFSEIQEIISSARHIMPADKDKIVYRVLYVENGGDETLHDFAERKGSNVLENLKLISIINEVDPSDNVFDRPVKYIQTVRYFKD